MQNADRWLPTKYVRRGGRLRATRNTAYLAAGSRLISDLIAAQYDAHLADSARGRLLDLGCGRVPLFGAYRPYVIEVVTVDWAHSDAPDSHVDICHDLDRPLPFPDSRFDTVLLSDVLEHVGEPQLVCSEIRRVLTPGGRLIGNTPFMYPIHEAPYDHFRYTEHGLRRLIKNSGLHVRVLSPLGGSLEQGCDLVAKHLCVLGAPGLVCAAALQSAAVWFGRTSSGRRMQRASGGHFTLGYFFIAEHP